VAALIDDDVLTRLRRAGRTKTIGDQIARRYGDVAGRINTYLPYETAPDLLAGIAASFTSVASAPRLRSPP
jgi:hypothetical protein